MGKYRVIIRAFTLRRDVGIALILARVLEAQGCDVVVASSRNFVDYLTKWKPHAVVINTNSQIEAVRRHAPDTALICLHGEGAQDLNTSYVKHICTQPGLYEKLDRVLVWGRLAREWFDELLPGVDHDRKVRVCGNPRLDFIRFNPALRDGTARREGIGVTGRFHQLNYYDGRPTIFALIVREENLSAVVKQCEQFSLVVRAVRYLSENTDKRLSLRPHPLEAPENYRYLRKYAAPSIDIDESLDFIDWAARQKVIMMPLSTSFLEAYLLDIPLVNISRLTPSPGRADELLSAMSPVVANVPNSYEELIEMLDSDLPGPPKTPEIDKHLDEVHDWNYGGSAVLRCAEAIIEAIQERSYPTGPRWPRALLDLEDEIRFRRILRRQPLHPNFNFKTGYHKVPEHYQTIVGNILASENARANEEHNVDE